MKCGREIAEDQVFCSDCLLDMEKHPVKPGTVVQLPKRQEVLSQKKGHFRPVLTPEEQLRKLRKRVRRLSTALALTLLLLAAMAFYFAHHLRSHTQLRPGQNYSAVITTEPSSEP